MKTLYELLGIPQNATIEEIEQAYKDMARRYHPDRNQNTKDKSFYEAKMKELNEAYNILKNHLPTKGENIINADATNQSQNDLSVLTALMQSKYKLAISLINQGADCNLKDEYGLSAIHYNSSLEVLKALISKGVDVNRVASYYGYTPLHYAAWHGKTEIAKFLLEKDANINSKGKSGETPLHVFSGRYPPVGGDDVGELLIRYKTDVNAQDKDGNTPLHWSLGAGSAIAWMLYGSVRNAKFLLRNGADGNIKNNYGFTPLDIAYKNNKTEYIELFKEYGLIKQNKQSSIFKVFKDMRKG